MIKILPVLFVYLFLTNCSAQKEAADYEVATRFVNAYIKALTEKDAGANFVLKSDLVTQSFKKAHTKLLKDAWKEDPEMGLGFDPVLDAQDNPDKGFEISAIDEKSGYVTLKGVDWPDFILVAHVILKNGKYLVDGCGVINIPKNKRASR